MSREFNFSLSLILIRISIELQLIDWFLFDVSKKIFGKVALLRLKEFCGLQYDLKII